jgi:hypothetical protein
MICACCRRRIEIETPYKARVARVLLLLRLRAIIENPTVTPVYIRRTRRERKKATFAKAA